MSEPLTFNTQPISATTRTCGVFGFPVRHSASPAMQNAGLAELRLDWRYLAFEVRPENLREAILGAKAMRFVGLNLTVPHKIPALGIVDVLDKSSKHWGAVNTIRFEAKTNDGRWLPLPEFPNEEIREVRSQGFNTDADAIVLALSEDLQVDLAGLSVLVLGAGGVGRVVALRLAAAGVSRLAIVNRTHLKALEVIGDIRRAGSRAEVFAGYPKGPVDLIVNATSLGLKPDDPLPLDTGQFPLQKARMVYDTIYRPVETRLLKAAKAAGCKAANGLGMLLFQGAKALEIWSGKPAPIEVMRAALKKHVYG